MFIHAECSDMPTRLAVETYPTCHGTWQHVSTTLCLGYGLGASPSHHMEDGMMWS